MPRWLGVKRVECARLMPVRGTESILLLFALNELDVRFGRLWPKLIIGCTKRLFAVVNLDVVGLFCCWNRDEDEATACIPSSLDIELAFSYSTGIFRESVRSMDPLHQNQYYEHNILSKISSYSCECVLSADSRQFLRPLSAGAAQDMTFCRIERIASNWKNIKFQEWGG